MDFVNRNGLIRSKQETIFELQMERCVTLYIGWGEEDETGHTEKEKWDEKDKKI